jgi:hypothetical protein
MESESLSEEYSVKTLIQYLSAIALAIFYLIYLGWTALSASVLADPLWIWVYYFTLVIGLLFPMYYAIGKENIAWWCLGLSLLLNSIAWMVLRAAEAAAAAMFLIVGLLFFIAPFLESRMKNWDLTKNLFHFLEGLFIVLGIALFANFDLNAMIGNTSANHVMPQFIYMGGGIMIAFAVCLLLYGLFNIFKMYTGEKIGGYFGDLSKIFYMLMVLVFLLGITYNVIYYPGVDHWAYVAGTSASMDFFRNMSLLGVGNLGAILLIILYIYGMGKIAKKFE